MNNNELDVILKLIKLTVDEKIIWTVSENPSSSVVGDVYQSYYKDWELSIYKVKVLEKSKGLVLYYRLKILNLNTKKAPILKENQQALKDLYNTIDNKSSMLDEFYKNILNE